MPVKSIDPAIQLARFEARFAPRAGRTLIVGSHIYAGKEDRRKRYADVVGVDMLPGPGVDVVLDLETEAPQGKFAHIECMSVLEHSRRPWLLAGTLMRALEDGGSLFVTVPFVWRVHGYPDDYWRFTTSGIRELFPGIVWEHEAYVHADSTDADHIGVVMNNQLPYYARTEVAMFGHK